MGLIAFLIDWAVRLVTLIILIDVILTYFMDPLHPLRRTLDRLVEPMLAPIRRLLPATTGIDFSPIVLILGLLVVNQIIQTILR